MTTTADLATPLPLTANRLPRTAPWVAALIAAAVAGMLSLALGVGLLSFAFLTGLAFAVVMTGWSLVVENRRSAVDRLMTTLVWGTFLVAIIPLVSLIWTVIARGAPVIDATFLRYSMFRTDLDAPVGIYHAIVGSVVITLFAALISIPVGVFSAIYLVEYGNGSRLARAITFLVDVMTGIPSIVAGLFAFAMFVMIFGPEVRMGFGGSVALALLMIPVVVRSTEEMLRLVPDDLREASYALGVPKWRTITKMVLPTSLAGIVTGITLAIARVVGETAPLLLIAGLTASTNFNAFSERMTTLPVLIYTQNARGYEEDIQIAWGAALVLILIVMVLNLAARVVGKIFAPKQGR